MDYLNSTIITMWELKHKNQVLLKAIDSCKKAIPIIQSELQTWRTEVGIKDESIFERDALILDLKSVVNYDKKYIKKLKRQKTVIGIGATVIIGVLTGFLIAK
jgi:hypothetical protein